MINCKCMMAAMKFLLGVFILGLVVGGTNADVQCQAGWKKFDMACYYFEHNVAKTWYDAEAHCVSSGSHLVSLHSDGELDFVVGFLAEPKFYWIGLTDQLEENTFIWSDNSPRDYTRWLMYRPDNSGNEDCAHFIRKGNGNEWNDLDCNRKLHYICKTPREIDECANPQCVNGGECVDGINSYTCECVPGFTGQNCEIEIDECANPQCVNGGECVDGINSYTCECVPGFTGQNCEIEVQCQAGWKKFDMACYYIEQDMTEPWDNAESQCVSLGGHLVSLHSDEENEFVVGFLAEQKFYWIGLTDQLEENTFIWSDNSPRDYTKWLMYRPDNSGNEDCAHFIRKGNGNEWNDLNCNHKLHYICKTALVA